MLTAVGACGVLADPGTCGLEAERECVSCGQPVCAEHVVVAGMCRDCDDRWQVPF